MSSDTFGINLTGAASSAKGTKKPFDDFSELQSHPAHLAVFIKYILSSNLDSSSLVSEPKIFILYRWCYGNLPNQDW